jgi:hypothetical protein
MTTTVILCMNPNTLRFFEALYPNQPDGYLLLWTLQDKHSYWHSATTPEAIAAQVSALPSSLDVYFGAGLSPQVYGSNQRCPADSIAAIPGVWADFDFLSPGHKKKNLPPNEGAILELLDQAELPPTISVHSGHGLQCYWLFTEPFRFSNELDREIGATLTRRWNNTLRILSRSRGWDMDATHDLARVLRVPGSWNNKAEPKPVLIVTMNDAIRYTRDEIAAKFIDNDDNAPLRSHKEYERIVLEEFVIDPAAHILASDMS